ncbi:putative kinase [Mycobacterium frederiksbergense]|uniref:Kinase n=2 Tax=Mycolicibacterium frederiksbergense TaxID=117567 RepID=A0ABT6KU13_9MYCO|nr:putative kinase [Mycolicibacterium frederiksbergense]
MVRLSFDQEAWSRGVTTMPLSEQTRREIERVLRTRLIHLVQQGADVVVDFSFWSRQMRDEYREVLLPMGVIPETVYLATDRDTVLERVRARRTEHGDDFRLSDELAADYFDHFEVPTAEEGPLTVISPSTPPQQSTDGAT